MLVSGKKQKDKLINENKMFRFFYYEFNDNCKQPFVCKPISSLPPWVVLQITAWMIPKAQGPSLHLLVDESYYRGRAEALVLKMILVVIKQFYAR